MKWLWSFRAVEFHLFFLTVGGVVLAKYLSGEDMKKFFPGNDWIWFTLLIVVGYPLVLYLEWLQPQLDKKAHERKVQEAQTQPGAVNARRLSWRRASLVMLAAAGVYFSDFGSREKQLLAYLMWGMTALGLSGINIWYGGPIDPRFDHQAENPPKSPVLTDELATDGDHLHEPPEEIG